MKNKKINENSYTVLYIIIKFQMNQLSDFCCTLKHLISHGTCLGQCKRDTQYKTKLPTYSFSYQ